MTSRTVSVSLPASGSTLSHALIAALTVAGGIAGMVLATGTSVDSATGVLVGLSLGALAGRLADGGGADEAWGQGVLAVGAAAFAARLFALDAAWLAWPLAVVALAAATGAPGARTATGRRVAWMMTVLGVAAGFAAAVAVFTVGGLAWSAGDLAATGIFGGLVATGAWLGRQQAEVVSKDGPGPAPARRLAAPEQVGDGRDAGHDGLAGACASLFEPALAELREVARRVDVRIDALRDGSAIDEVIADQVADAVQRTVSDAASAVARWAHVDVARDAERADRIRDRLERLEAERDAEPDVAVRAAADAAIDRQRRHLEALEVAAASRRRFGFRLERMHASLELLELGLDRALTSDGGLDPDAVDGMVELLTDTCDALDDDLEVAIAGHASAPSAVA